MGYRVIYFDESKKTYELLKMHEDERPISQQIFGGDPITWAIHSWDDGRNLLLEVLFPVTGLEAEKAFRVMIQDLQVGKDVGETIAVFIHSVFPENLY